jgi:type II secretory pathway pseudopilin PulG
MRLLVALCIIGLLVTPCFGGALNEQNQDQDQGQLQGQAQGQLQGQAQGQLQGQAQAAIAAQGQGQGQIALGKVKTDVNVSDNSKTETTAIAFPSTGATEGVASANASYMFGNLGLSDTEMYKKGAHIIQTVLAVPDNIIEPELKAAIVKDVISKMRESIRPRRLLGIGPEQHSKNLINLFGLLSFDSLWADGQKPFQSKGDM